MHIVLATGKVPQEVAHIHIVELITQEELYVVEKRGFGQILLSIVTESCIGVAFVVHNNGGKGFVEGLVFGVEEGVVVVGMSGRPNAGEQHFHFARIHRLFAVAGVDVLVGLFGRVFHHACPHFVAFLKAG